MSRVAAALGVLALALLAVVPARAQVAVYFQPLGDTATGAVPGKPTPVEVRASDSLAATVQGANLTFYFDASKVQILGVQIEAGTGLDSIVDTVRGPGSFTVSATGAAVGSDAPLYQLLLQLSAGASSGTYLWVKGDSVPVSGVQRVAVSSIGQICHATDIWGDVSGDGVVNSRDALIILSAAVGLPVTGFNLAVGDVDGDGLVNSRDALLVLSYTIGLPLTGVPGVRLGAGVPDACPGLTAPGDSVVFFRNDVPSGLYALGATSTVPVAIPGATATAPDPGARLSPDGKTVVYVCPGSGGYQICRINTDGSGFAQLTSDTLATNSDPDWSPAGDSIVFLRYGSSISVMDASGIFQRGVDLSSARDVKWSRDGTEFAFVDLSGALWTAGTTGSGLTAVTTGFSDVKSLRWSPAGDSIAFVRTTDTRLWVVPVTGGTPGIMFGFAGLITGGDWSSAGILISLNTGTGAPSIWFSKGINAPIYRVTRPAVGDLSPTWRRSP